MRDLAEALRRAEDVAQLESIDTGRVLPPIELERLVAAALRDTLECEATAIVRVGAPVHGRIPLVDAVIVGDEAIVERSGKLVRDGGESRPLSFARRHPDGERLLPLAEVARLLGAEPFRASYAEMRERHGIADQLRVMLFDRGRVIAWLGALATKENAFDARLVRRAEAILPRLSARLRVADRMRRECTPSLPGDFVATCDGAIEQASSLGRAWLALPDIAAALSPLLKLADASRDEAHVFHLGGATLRLVRTDGASGARYLGHLDPVTPLTCPPVSTLTDAQLGVARYAASGATVNEIGRTLGIAAGTVRVHLRAAYERLGVANRIELARELAGWDG